MACHKQTDIGRSNSKENDKDKERSKKHFFGVVPGEVVNASNLQQERNYVARGAYSYPSNKPQKSDDVGVHKRDED